MKILHKGQSIAERGTLAQLKNAFGHNHLMPLDVMNSFNYADDYMRFSTEAHVIYLIMKEFNMDSVESVPDDQPDPDTATREMRKQYFDMVSKLPTVDIF
jgi:hypothetical protein